MATIENGYMGGFSGRLGTAVGYRWRGRWCLRSWQKHVRNPRTEAQQAHRMLFKQQVQLAGRMNWVLRNTFDLTALQHGMTACNYFVKVNQRAFSAEGDTLAVDWASLRLSEGPVAPVQFAAPEVTEGTVLSVSFERNPLHVRADRYDRVYLYVYCPTAGTGYFSAPSYRRDGRVAAVLPQSFAGCEVQLWGMVQDAAGRWSDSIYIGCGPLEDTALADNDLSSSADVSEAYPVGICSSSPCGSLAGRSSLSLVGQTAERVAADADTVEGQSTPLFRPFVSLRE